MRVAIVDDNARIRRLLREVLEERPDVEVVGEATDGDEVLGMIVSARPDLVVMDYSMDRVDGLVAARELRSRHPAVDVVAFTSAADPGIADAFLEIGAAKHFHKAEVDDLIAYVAGRAAGATSGER